MHTTYLLTTLTTLLALSTSKPLTRRQAPNYPPHSQSKLFALVANVTSPSHDLTPSIQNYVLSSYHIGAGEAYAILLANTSATAARVFYENGTAEEVRYNRGTIVSDGGTPVC